MAKGASLGTANPVEAHRRKMRERETKKNKDQRDQRREVAMLYKDTTKLEHKIEQYRKITKVRKMTAAEREKLQGMETELKAIKEKQDAAGIKPNKSQNDTGAAIGYNPLAIAEKDAEPEPDAGNGSSEDEQDQSFIPQTVSMTVDDLDDRPATIANDKDEGALPPMPPGTPPLLLEDLEIDGGGIWPPLPSGPSPQYLEQQQTSNAPGGPRQPEKRKKHHHPYGPNRAVKRKLAPQSATVLSAEPEIRDLRNELTTLVPTRIARKPKQQPKPARQEQQQQPTEHERPRTVVVSKMAINAAPDVDSDN